MIAIREISNWEAISPVIRGLSRRRSRIRRRGRSERASHTGPPSDSISVATSAIVHPEHSMLALHISPQSRKEVGMSWRVSLTTRRSTPALIRNDRDLGKQVVGEAQCEHGNHSALEQCDDARLTVDDLRYQLKAGPGSKKPHQARADYVTAHVRLADRRQPPAHIGPAHDRRIQEREQRLDVAARAGHDESIHDTPLLRWIDREPCRSCLFLNTFAGAAGELAARRRRSSNHRRDLLERKVEPVWQDEEATF